MTRISLAVWMASTTIAFAQTGPPAGHPAFGPEMRIMGFEGIRPGTLVAGAPFSGLEVTTNTQTLANGTRIQTSVSTQYYRDAAGRTRSERTFSGVGPWGGGTPTTMIDIFDPVAGVAYLIDPTNQTASKMSLPPHSASESGTADRAGESGSTTASATASGDGFRWKIRHQELHSSSEQVASTDLGTKTIQGLPAKGTLTTRTIPAGAIGNDQPIAITTERWYSADLQIALQSKRSDPRMGDVESTFQNISRAAPDASLFAPPAGYTISAGAMRHGGHNMIFHTGPPPPSDNQQ